MPKIVRVLYDHQAFEMQDIGGISRYFAELISRNTEAALSLMYTDNVYIRSNPALAAELKRKDDDIDHFLWGARFRGKRRLFGLYRAWTGKYPDNRTISEKAIDSGRFDVLHPTYYDPYFLEHLGRKPFVLTVHDMIHERFPEFFPVWDSTAENKRTLAEKAALIIAVSENTKQDIVERLGVDPGRIRVVYHGSGLTRASRPRLSLPERYILYTGSREGYKNFWLFAEAAAEVMREDPWLQIVCTGRAFGEDEVRRLRALGIVERVLQFRASEEELAELYSRARCFVFPSLYEGFGIPILEAFESGCPALLARASCFFEIGEDAAIYFDPRDEADLTYALREVLAKEELRRDLAAKGRDRSRAFTWDKTYRRTVNCYREIA